MGSMGTERIDCSLVDEEVSWRGEEKTHRPFMQDVGTVREEISMDNRTIQPGITVLGVPYDPNMVAERWSADQPLPLSAAVQVEATDAGGGLMAAAASGTMLQIQVRNWIQIKGYGFGM